MFSRIDAVHVVGDARGESDKRAHDGEARQEKDDAEDDGE